MPRVPSLDNFQVAAAPGQRARFTVPSGPTADGIAAQQQSGFAQATQQAGNIAARLATDMQQEANEVRVIDAVTRAKEHLFDLQYGEQGFTQAKGVQALQRPDGKLLADEYGERFKTLGDELAGSLGNDAQRQMFRKQFDQMAVGLRGDAMRHTAQEFRTYQAGTFDAAASAAGRQIALNYRDLQDDGPVAEGMRTLTAAVKEKARLLGMPQTWADEQVISQVSKAHRTAIKAALEDNQIEQAGAYLDKFKGSMEADDILAVRGVLDKERRTRSAVQVATQVIGELAPKVAPSDFDRMVGITLQTESNGRRYGKDGQLLTSPKGAKGEMQVLDSTMMDPGLGVKPARDNSPDERARVGRDYLRALIKRYDGDPAKAWAAYNGGMGRVDEAVMRAKASRGEGADWLTFMPAESQAYVAKNLKALQEGFGAPAAPTALDVQTAVRNRLGPNADPMTVDAATKHATAMWETVQRDKAARDDNLMAEAQRVLLSNGGNFTALPASVRGALPPGKVDDLMAFGAKIAKGENVATDWNLYYTLTTDPALLQRTNLAALQHKLAPAEFKQLTGHQADLNKQDDNARTRLQSGKDILQQYMREVGIDPTPKDTDKKGAAQVGQFLAAYQARITERENATGKKLGDKELREEAAALFKPIKVSGLIFDTDTPAAMVTPTDRVTVPEADRKQIEASLRRAGRPVTEAAVENLYRAHNRIAPRTNG